MKKRILLLSDDLRMTSGVATMSKEIVLGTVHKYDWVQLAGAINHPEYGKTIDLSEDIQKRTGVEDASLVIYPFNGYGNINTLRRLIKLERIDAILHFTDPHYWSWLYENESEIRNIVPLLYYHVWDNTPDPLYNRNFYESCDWIGCISKQTYGIVKRVGNLDNGKTWSPLKEWQVSYVPHGINEDTFKPLDVVDEGIRKLVHGDKEYEFVLFYNNRNIRRKQTSDVIHAFSKFCDMLPKEESEKCLLFMHTTAVDTNGTDLRAVVDVVCKDYDVKITDTKIEQEKLNQFYNVVDCTINIASNEGFGLTTLESLMTATPIIVNVTGGLQDQCGFNIDASEYVEIKTLHDKNEWSNKIEHGEWVSPVWSSTKSINGSPTTPYIFEDKVNVNDVSESIYKMYKIGKEERKRVGLLGREYAVNNFSNKVMCDKIIDGIETTFTNWVPKQKFNLYKII
jgi:glycosyltransferase involved in cell wall biosynthesis